ncbi:MAG TPA: DUF3467 domain-containing protein [Gemmataceae bacterium]|nr:DUF3467 domain-containing protein [Gemmataceae bacterium]
MPDEAKSVQPAGSDGRAPSPQSVQVPVDTSAMSSAYTNFFRASGSAEELFLDFGVNIQQSTPTGPVPIRLTQQLVMSFYTAKKLMQFLQWAVNRHESQFGVLELDPQHRQRPGLRAGPGGKSPGQ